VHHHRKRGFKSSNNADTKRSFAVSMQQKFCIASDAANGNKSSG
jgi:hypothetical protein